MSDLDDTLRNIYKRALLQKKYFVAARSLSYSLAIKDKRTDDSLYFKNSDGIDRLIIDPSTAPAFKMVLEVLMAKRLFKFHSYPRANLKRYESDTILHNYASYDRVKLDNIANGFFQDAIAIALRSRNADMTELLWLSSDPYMFLFQPDVADIIFAEASRYQPATYKSWKEDEGTNREKREYISLLEYSSQYQRLSSQTDSTYVNRLRASVNSVFPAVRAFAILRLSEVLESESEKYFNRPIYGSKLNVFDTAYRYKALEVVDLFRNHAVFLDSFLIVKNALILMLRRLERKELQVSLKNFSLPHQPILVDLSFRNIDTFYYRILKTKFDYTQTVVKDDYSGYEVMKDSTIILHSSNDFNNHATYIRLSGLPVGHYSLQYSDQPFSLPKQLKGSVSFAVTSLSMISNHGKVFVLDRQTGKPIQNGKLTAWNKKLKQSIFDEDSILQETHTTDKRGTADIQNTDLQNLQVSSSGDTISGTMDYNEKGWNDDEEVYSKADYDDLVEFYEENAEAKIFTDRSIYRPGQEVFFKAIFITRDRHTGSRILMTPKTMGRHFFARIYKRWLNESMPLLNLVNPFGNEVDSLKVSLNEFGSFSGSFKIPKGAATGDWSIEPDYVEATQTGDFRVEEYKRPTYEIIITNPKTELRLGDKFVFDIKLKSFSGATLNNVRLRYSLTRSSLLPSLGYKDTVLVDTSAYTDINGAFSIEYTDHPLKSFSESDDTWNQSYRLIVEATDPAGETYESGKSINIASRPLTILAKTKQAYNRHETNTVSISVKDQNAGIVAKTVKARIYRLTPAPLTGWLPPKANIDYLVYPWSDLIQWFPEIASSFEDSITKTLVLEQALNTRDISKLQLDSIMFIAGEYELQTIVEERGVIRGQGSNKFQVYDTVAGVPPSNSRDFSFTPDKSIRPGGKLRYLTSVSAPTANAIYHLSYNTIRKRKVKLEEQYFYRTELAGMQTFVWQIPADATGMIEVTKIYVRDNDISYSHTQCYVLKDEGTDPEIIIEKYRKVLSPDAKENFVIRVKARDQGTAAELMTTMYDAALDQLEPHQWDPRLINRRSPNVDISWRIDINEDRSGKQYNLDQRFETPLQGGDHPIWWLPANLIRSVPDAGSGSYYKSRADQLLAGRVMGVNITPNQLDEVVVVGYATHKKMSLTGSVSTVTLNGLTSITEKLLIVLDGKIYDGDISSIDPNLNLSGLILRGADATSLFGSAAEDGVLVLSTTGEFILPDPVPPPPVVVRKNFSETAFFYPSLHADKKGMYSFSFTVPQSLTEWNWKLFAHDKNGYTGSAERILNTSLPLMVRPNIPRIIYQGDRFMLQSRISNLDTGIANGKIRCRIEEATTGRDITDQLVSVIEKDFSVPGKSTKSEGFEIKVTAEQLEPLRIIITIQSGNFSDGEEHVLPVMASSYFVHKSVPLNFQTDTVINSLSLPRDARLYGVGLSGEENEGTFLLRSLAYLANYSFECAEQLTNKIRANLIAINLMRKDSILNSSFRKYSIADKISGEAARPDQLQQDASPWEQLTTHNSNDKEQIYELLDTGSSTMQVRGYLEKLYALQNPDGGLTWFKGGKTNIYISQYVLGAFGQMKNSSLMLLRDFRESAFEKFISRLTNYCDGRILDSTGMAGSGRQLEFAYSRSYWLKEYPLSIEAKERIRSIITAAWRNNSVALIDRAQLSLVSLKYKDIDGEFLDKATQEIVSISQAAIHDENGIRWKEYSKSERLDRNTQETVALLSEMFAASERYEYMSDGILKWILSARSNENWRTTKSVSAVVELIMKKNLAFSEPLRQLRAFIGSDTLQVTNDILNGNVYDFTKATSLTSVEITSPIVGASNKGKLIYYYFTNSPEQDNGTIKIRKSFLVYRNSVWEPVMDSSALHIGERVSVKLILECTTPLQYVYIDDKRAAAFEPVDKESGDVYGQSFGYYRSVRDGGMQMFADNIPAGRHEISYELIVSHEGQFTSAPAALQCMYRPDLEGYSNSTRIITKEQAMVR